MLYAFIMVSAIIWLVLRDVKDTLLVLVPIALASILTAALTVLVGMPFNYANIIALPLLVGIGVDNGIHVVHRMRTEDAERLFDTSTMRAVLASGLTTVASFGNLAFSSHVGTASMGILLALGLAASMAATLIVLPAWLKVVAAEAERPPHDARARHGCQRFPGLGRRARAARGWHGRARVRAARQRPAQPRGSRRRDRDRRSHGARLAARERRRVAPPCSTSRPTIGSGSPTPRRCTAPTSKARSTCSRPRRPAGATRMVYTSSVAVLGINRDRTPADEDTPVTVADMVGHYKRSKFLAEQAVRRRASELGFPVVTVNPSTPIGPRDIKPTPTGRILLDAAAGRMPAFVDTGLNLVHVDDVALGHLAALKVGTARRALHLGRRRLHAAADPRARRASTSVGERVRFACRIGRSIRSRSRRKVGHGSANASRA